MFTLSLVDAVLVGLALVTALVLVLAGIYVVRGRATRPVEVTVRCPLLGRRVAARLVRDEWTQRFVDVARCSALEGYSGVICAKECLGRKTTPAHV